MLSGSYLPSLDWQTVVAAVVLLFFILWPTSQILHRMGFPRWIVLILIVPAVGLTALVIGLWVLAYKRWPNLPKPT